jgi:hypothetical protein
MKNDPPVHDANVFGAGHDDKDGNKHDLENKVSRYLNRRRVQAIHVDIVATPTVWWQVIVKQQKHPSKVLQTSCTAPIQSTQYCHRLCAYYNDVVVISKVFPHRLGNLASPRSCLFKAIGSALDCGLKRKDRK